MTGMRRVLKLLIALVVSYLLAIESGSAQGLDRSRWAEGFTVANPDWMARYMGDDQCARRVRGYVFDSVGERDDEIEVARVPCVVVELKRDSNENPIRLWKATTNSAGEFRIRNVPKGMYILKTSKDGFSPLYGRIRVSADCPKKKRLRLGIKLDL